MKQVQRLDNAAGVNFCGRSRSRHHTLCHFGPATDGQSALRQRQVEGA